VDLPEAGEAVLSAHVHHDDARCFQLLVRVHRTSFNGTEIG
jgi:hypothetical protein